MPTVSEFDRYRILPLRTLEQSSEKSATEVKCPKSTAQRIFERYSTTGQTANEAKSGKLRLLSPKKVA